MILQSFVGKTHGLPVARIGGFTLLGGKTIRLPKGMRSVASTKLINCEKPWKTMIETVASCISVVSQLGRFRACIDPVHSASNLGAADQ